MCFAINIVSRWYLWTKAVLKFSPKFHVPCMFSFFGNCYSCVHLHEVLILIIYSSSVIPTSIPITEKWSFASTLWPVLGMWSFWFKLHMDLHVKAAGDGECCSEAAFSDSEITFFFSFGWIQSPANSFSTINCINYCVGMLLFKLEKLMEFFLFSLFYWSLFLCLMGGFSLPLRDLPAKRNP